jgi:hypothetical protein
VPHRRRRRRRLRQDVDGISPGGRRVRAGGRPDGRDGRRPVGREGQRRHPHRSGRARDAGCRRDPAGRLGHPGSALRARIKSGFSGCGAGTHRRPTS